MAQTVLESVVPIEIPPKALDLTLTCAPFQASIQQLTQLGIRTELTVIYSKRIQQVSRIELLFFDLSDGLPICKLDQADGLYGLVDSQTGNDLNGMETWFNPERYRQMQDITNFLLDHWDFITRHQEHLDFIRTVEI